MGGWIKIGVLAGVLLVASIGCQGNRAVANVETSNRGEGVWVSGLDRPPKCWWHYPADIVMCDDGFIMEYENETTEAQGVSEVFLLPRQ